MAVAGVKPTIAVLSGKGGTGKTFVAVNLAAAAPSAHYFDCDVEEPNGHLFLQTVNVKSEPISVLIPEVNGELCTACRRCIDFCRFNALALIGDDLFVFEEICHSCGGCALICPTGALSEREEEIGCLQRGRARSVEVFSGMLNIGEISGVPIIEHMLRLPRDPSKVTFIDCPPGAACSVLESIAAVDYCLIVVEPTLFGLHNFKLVYQLASCLGKRVGVVANKWLEEYDPVEDFCREKGVPILAKIPYEPELARLNSAGKVAVWEGQPYLQLFRDLLAAVMEEVGREAVTHSQRQGRYGQNDGRRRFHQTGEG